MLSRRDRGRSRHDGAIVRTEPLGGSPLARAGIDGPTWRVVCRRRPTLGGGVDGTRRGGAGERESTGIGSARSHRRSPRLGAAAARLERVAQGRGVVVTTGQQPGLFGGPDLHVVQSAERARAGRRDRGRHRHSGGAACSGPRTTTPISPRRRGQRSRFPAAPSGSSVAAEALRWAVRWREMPLTDLAAGAGGARARLRDDRRRAPDARGAQRVSRSARRLGGAYLQLLRELFEPLGIAVLDAAHASVASAARPFLVRALDRSGDVAQALRDRDEAIVSAGFRCRSTEVEGLSLVFERPRRNADKRRVPLTEAAAVAASIGDGAGSATVLSPNVLLRPVIERALSADGGLRGWSRRVRVFRAGRRLSRRRCRWRHRSRCPDGRRPSSSRTSRASWLASVSMSGSLREPHRAEGRLATESIPPTLRRAFAGVTRHELDAPVRGARADATRGQRPAATARGRGRCAAGNAASPRSPGAADRRRSEAPERRDHDTDRYRARLAVPVRHAPGARAQPPSVPGAPRAHDRGPHA